MLKVVNIRPDTVYKLFYFLNCCGSR